jgi:hypothetical protein
MPAPCERAPSMHCLIKSVQVGAPFRREPVCETERFRAEVRSLGCIAVPFATGTCASVCARVHVRICVRACARACVFQMRRPGDSTMLCSNSYCRSSKHYRKAAAAAVDSELVSVPSSPAARATRLASGCC